MNYFHYVVDEEELTIEKLLLDKWKIGKKTVHQMRMDKAVTDPSGEPVDWRIPLPLNAVLHFHFHAKSDYEQDDVSGVDILFEDEHIIAAVKPAGISVHPNEKDNGGTFMNAMMKSIATNGGEYVEHIHRLDQGTSGIILCAKHPIAKSIMDRKLEQHEVTRIYHAEVEGVMKRTKGVLNYPIGRDRHHSTKRRVSPSGQKATTHFRVMERRSDSTTVEASLVTGRTHQIRVHFSHIGHPVVGDTLYDGSPTEDGQYRLAAKKISFEHPITEKPITIEWIV
ncbi:RluA family pseudouridine synthase [Sporosarcina sp. USHLN248]|uniref:RluA family pseudouridine synthase n=1 Tax=Sporosarcina sp. USHLN248 TaxID=3081300 RepID=UPI0030167F2B